MGAFSLWVFLLAFSQKVDQNIFFSQPAADHMAGVRARTLMSCMETMASSLIIFFIFVDCHNVTCVTHKANSIYKHSSSHKT